MIFAATPPYDGTLARYYRVPGSLVYPLPDHVTLEDGAMAIGASRIIAVDIVPSRLEFAQQYVGAETYQPPPPAENEARMDYSRRNADVMKKTLGIEDRGPKAIDLVIDASGAEVSIQTAFYVVKIGGIFVQVGMGKPENTIDLGMLMVKELVYKGSFRYGPGDYTLAIALVSQGKIDLKPLVTHRYTFQEALTAFQATRAGKSEDGKGVIKAIISGPDVAVDNV
ncbi:hypothetical protein VNI00_001310 [Paramarasmius palmivorus]|uniref:Alcohol dehydrogenase-like C-terminal domain-containing protein n=1 Tax=Paramarasmius palmivorus TaxID=297713 RepID=A0AAW0E8S3_9AGAR